jgi:hypothetical protein
MVMFSVRFVPDGIEILNQHWTIIALAEEFQLKPPVESDTSNLALPEKMAAHSEQQ